MQVQDSIVEATSVDLRNYFQSHVVHFPVDSFSLLRLLVANSSGAPSQARLRLTDLSKFEGILESLARKWEYGTLVLSRDERRKLFVIGAHVPDGPSRKRKRGEAELNPGLSNTQTTLPLAATMEGISSVDREIFSLLSEGTAKGRLLAEQHASTTGVFEPICPSITREQCSKSGMKDCAKVHFSPVIRPHTDPSLGMCSYLNTCFSEPLYAMSPSIHPLPSVPRPPGSVALPSGLGAGGRGKDKAPCRYLHYEVSLDPMDDRKAPTKPKRTHRIELGLGPIGKGYSVLPPQWLSCDLRHFDCSVLGKFHVIMADPPWDIHMSLPYGTMTDDEMRKMQIPKLQDEGLLFLWVTGRAMEVGRECLKAWGYHRIDEIIWVKTNQLQRVIRTGRTGHWLNHTKEHMLVGVKLAEDGSVRIPPWVNRGLDVDVIVSEVRETSRKPEEAYGLIERMCPGGRKIEIFGRQHNTRPGWLTLGNQLGDDRIYEEDVVARIKSAYPDSNIKVTPLPENFSA